MSLLNSTTGGIVLPELVNPIVFDYGFDADGKPVALTFDWRLNALKRSNYAQFVALQDEQSARVQRKVNQAAIEDNANLIVALEPSVKGPRGKKDAAPIAVAPSVERYKKLDAALLDLGVDLENAQQIYIEQGESVEPLAIFQQKIQAVNDALAMMQPFITRTPEDLEVEIEKRRRAYVEANEDKIEICAKMLAHLCTRFYFGEGEKIPCTVENLTEVFESEFLEKAVMAVVEAHRAPLVLRSNTAAS